MPNPVINRRIGGVFQCPKMIVSGVALDTLESYANGVLLDGLNLGTGWCKTAKFADRTGYLGLTSLDTMESYSNGANLFGLNGGTGWPSAYAADNVVTVLPANAWPATGSTFTLTAAPTGGFPAYSYQWLRNGVPLTNTGDFSGVTTATLSIANYSSSYDDNYSVEVTDTSGRSAFLSTTCAVAHAVTAGQLWAAVVAQTNSGTWPSLATVNAADIFNTAISSIASRIYHLNFVAPDSLIAFRTPFIASVGNTLWTSVTRGGPPAESLTVAGWKGTTNDTNGRVYDSGVIPSSIGAFNSGNGGFSLYFSDASIAGLSAAHLGGFDGTRALLISGDNAFDSHSYFMVNDSGSNVASPVASGLGGFFMASRTATNRIDGYFSNSTHAWSSIGNNTGVSSATPCTTSVGFGGSLYPSSVVNPNSARLSFFAVHDGFSSADGKILADAAQAFRVAMGGGFL